MTPDTRGAAARALTQDFVIRYPQHAAGVLDTLAPDAAAELLRGQPPDRAGEVLTRLQLDRKARVLELLEDSAIRMILPSTDPARIAPALARLGADAQARVLGALSDDTARELRALMSYPRDTAGSLMDPGVTILRRDGVAREALTRLRTLRHKQIWELYVVDDDGRLAGSVQVQVLAVADPGETIADLMTPATVSLPATASREEVVEVLEQHGLSSLPVVDFDGHLIGVIRQMALVAAATAEASSDLQAMVGASRDERALSPASFAIRKRLPWLQINLLTAFLAAFVVGLFEDTIAQFTALAVLLPVVAGQSGNTGSQALAVTMRGLALREIRSRHWLRVAWKESVAGFVNGVAVAVVCGVAVLAWSRSVGLTMVIGVAMIISMTVAGLSGASIPIILRSLGQDPAQSSSIVLTTVTDVLGFLTFLGLATLASGML